MTRDNSIRYLPRSISDELRYGLGDDTLSVLDPGDGLWKVERLLERAFAEGYDEGYSRGRQDGYHHGRVDWKPKSSEETP